MGEECLDCFDDYDGFRVPIFFCLVFLVAGLGFLYSSFLGACLWSFLGLVLVYYILFVAFIIFFFFIN